MLESGAYGVKKINIVREKLSTAEEVNKMLIELIEWREQQIKWKSLMKNILTPTNIFKNV